MLRGESGYLTSSKSLALDDFWMKDSLSRISSLKDGFWLILLNIYNYSILIFNLQSISSPVKIYLTARSEHFLVWDSQLFAPNSTVRKFFQLFLPYSVQIMIYKPVATILYSLIKGYY